MRLLVRQVTLKDMDILFSILSDPMNMRFYDRGLPWNRADIEHMIHTYPENDSRLICAPGLILLKPALEAIGFGGVGYYQSEGVTADLLFVIRKEYWGRGLATELAKAAVKEAFTHPEVKTIFATVMPQNHASIRVLEKTGMHMQSNLPQKNRLLYVIERDPPMSIHVQVKE
jgi:[ribosomal protein S5]-alanine N-acetyltransferase